MRNLRSGILPLLAFLLVLSLLYISSCNDSDDSIFSRETEFKIGITDIPCTDLFTAVNITFSSFVIEDVESSETIDLVPPDGPLTINLLDYINPNVFRIPFDIEPGTYKMISVTISGVEIASDALTPEQVQAINAALATFMPITYTFGDDARNVIFTVPAAIETTVIIDISCNESMLQNGELFSFAPHMDIVDIVHR